METKPNLKVVKSDDDRPSTASTGGNGGGGNLTNHRLTEAEHRIEKLEDTMSEIKETLAAINVKLEHTATKAWILGGTLTVVAAIFFTAVQILLRFSGT